MRDAQVDEMGVEACTVVAQDRSALLPKGTDRGQLLHASAFARSSLPISSGGRERHGATSSGSVGDAESALVIVPEAAHVGRARSLRPTGGARCNGTGGSASCSPHRHPLPDRRPPRRACAAIRFPPGREYSSGSAVAAILWVGVFHALGLYAPQRLPRFEEFRRTISAAGIGIVVIILLTFWFDVYLSRSWMAITLVIAWSSSSAPGVWRGPRVPPPNRSVACAAHAGHRDREDGQS